MSYIIKSTFTFCLIICFLELGDTKMANHDCLSARRTCHRRGKSTSLIVPWAGISSNTFTSAPGSGRRTLASAGQNRPTSSLKALKLLSMCVTHVAWASATGLTQT